jgi:hypothetical protein
MSSSVHFEIPLIASHLPYTNIEGCKVRCLLISRISAAEDLLNIYGVSSSRIFNNSKDGARLRNPLPSQSEQEIVPEQLGQGVDTILCDMTPLRAEVTKYGSIPISNNLVIAVAASKV